MLNCTRCETTGFLNLHQLTDEQTAAAESADDYHQHILAAHCGDDELDVCVCDCCGDGDEGWHGLPGEHYSSDDPSGPNGPYAGNGGLCHCH